jgi:hypothetical protein
MSVKIVGNTIFYKLIRRSWSKNFLLILKVKSQKKKENTFENKEMVAESQFFWVTLRRHAVTMGSFSEILQECGWLKGGVPLVLWSCFLLHQNFGPP